MAFERLEFSKNWNSSADFPTLQTDEIQVRADMQLLHDESRNALNALMEALENGGRDALVRFGSDEVRYIRMNTSGGLEVSSNGVDYSIVSTGAAGGAAAAIHAAQHRTGGTDPLSPASIGAQPTVTGAATTITGSNLTANRALVSNSSGKVAVSAVTATELGYLDGVTSGIQNQLNGKAASGHAHTAVDVGAFGFVRILDNTDDLDNVLAYGTYAFSTSSMPSNAPFSNAAVVFVYGTNNATSQKIQFAIRYGEAGYFAYRAYYDKKWLNWVHVASKADVAGVTAKSLGAFGFNSEIVSGANLNDYVDSGTHYIQQTNAKKDKISNLPVENYGFLSVFSHNPTGVTKRVIQIYTRGATASQAFYIRKGYDGSWTDWFELLHTGNAVSQLNTLGVAWKETGSYTGTGSSSADVKITFSKVPKFISVHGTGTVNNGTVSVFAIVDVGVGAGIGWYRREDSSSVNDYETATKASVSGNTVTLSSVKSHNLNESFTYNWVAHG